MPEHPYEGLVDPVGIRLLQRPVRERLDERPDPVRQPTHHGIRERDRALEAGAAHQLDRFVDSRMRRGIGVTELVRAKPQRGPHRRVELPHRPPPEGLDRVVERPDSLDGAVREPLREGPLALVEPLRSASERAVGVGVLLEDPHQHLVRRTTGRADHERQTKIAHPIVARSQARYRERFAAPRERNSSACG